MIFAENEYGPFADLVAVAFALVAVFSVFVSRMIGRTKDWTWLIADTPDFLASAGARIATVAMMAVSFVTINSGNRPVFIGICAATGIAGLVAVRYFDGLRRRHVMSVPLVNVDGSELKDSKGRLRTQQVVICGEDELLPGAKEALAAARKKHGGVSLRDFMAGYGSSKVNDPEALWDRTLLAKTANRLASWLTYVILLASFTLFVAALIITRS